MQGSLWSGKSDLILALLLTQLAGTRVASPTNLPTGQLNTHTVTIHSMPVNFEPNRGQTTEPARFIGRTGSLEIDLFPKGFGLLLAGKGRRRTKVEASFVGARGDVSITASDKKASETNYILGPDPAGWRTHIPNFGRVNYTNLYPGIDAVFYGNGQQLEHDFVVAPGGDYHLIRLLFHGSRHIALDAEGNLRLILPDGDLAFCPPVVYQNIVSGRQNRQGRFILLGKEKIGFEIGDYDRSQPLFIDPVLNYSTYLANLSIDVAAVTVDSSGNAYVTGQGFSGSYPVTPGAFQPVCDSCGNTSSDVFITKLNADGSGQLYSTFLGGSNYDQPSGIAVDVNGNALVVGWTQSTDFPLKNPISHGYVGVDDGPYGFIASLSPDGSSLNYSSILGGAAGENQSSSTYASAIALDASGNAYISGITDSPVIPVTPGALNWGTPAYPENIVYVSKFSPAGSLAYSALLGDVSFSPPSGSGLIGVMGINVDSSGDANIAGDGGSLWPTTSGAYQPNFASVTSTNKAPFVAKLSADGSTLLYSTFIGADAVVSGIAVNSNGDAFVAGSGAPSAFPTTPNAYQAAVTSSLYGSFFSELNDDGSQLVYSSFLSGASSSSVTSVTGVGLDGSRNIWLAGFTADPQYPLVNPIQSIPAVNSTALPSTQSGFVSEFDPTGTNLLFSTYFSGQAITTEIYSLALDPSGKVYIAGTAGSDLYTTSGAYLNSVTPPPPGFDYTYGFLASIDASTPAPAVCIAYPANLGIYYGLLSVGTSSSQNLKIQNCGTQSLTISSVHSSSSVFTIPVGSNQCQSAVAPGSSCTLSVSFTPPLAQSYAAVLSLTSNASIPETFLPLEGNGAVPVVSILSDLLTFPAEPVGTKSPSQIVLLTNTGEANLTFTGISITGPFAITASGTTCSTSSPVGVSGSCTAAITFTPTAVGAASGSLSFTDNASGSPQTVSLSGTGTGAVVSLSAPLTFPAEPIGTTSPSQTVTLTNTGNASLTFTAIGATGPFAIATSGTTCSNSSAVAATKTCTVALTFTPTVGGPASGSLSFSDNAPSSPQSVALSGTGPDFALTSPSGSSTSATVAPGSPATYTLSLGGEGGLSGTVNFTCTGAPSEATCAVSPNPATLGSSASNITVTITTAAPSSSAPLSRPLPPAAPLSPGPQNLLMLGLVLAAMAWAVKHRNQPASRGQSMMALLAAGLLLTLALAGCGGGGGGGGPAPNPGTPAGTYTVTVTGTTGSGSTALSHTVTFTLIVS